MNHFHVVKNEEKKIFYRKFPFRSKVWFLRIWLFMCVACTKTEMHKFKLKSKRSIHLVALGAGIALAVLRQLRLQKMQSFIPKTGRESIEESLMKQWWRWRRPRRFNPIERNLNFRLSSFDERPKITRFLDFVFATVCHAIEFNLAKGRETKWSETRNGRGERERNWRSENDFFFSKRRGYSNEPSNV